MGKGVTQSAGKVRITFTYNGERCRETLKDEFIPSKIKAAEELLQKIHKKINAGSFVYEDFFPKSMKLKKGAIPRASEDHDDLLKEVMPIWLETKGKMSPNTLKCYTNASIVWTRDIFAPDVRMCDLTAMYVESKIGSHPFASAKIQCEYMIVLRGACALYAKDHRTWTNPVATIKNPSQQEKEVLPLSRPDMNRVLEYIKTNEDVRLWCWFVWMFETGMRPEEGIALRWTDIVKDEDTGESFAAVRRARTLSKIGPCKTYEERNVDLSDEAVEALKVLKLHPQYKPGELDEIFQNPNINARFNDNRCQSDMWNKVLKKLHFKLRRSYNTRHTFATLRLKVGAVPMYVSRQMGHKTLVMVLRRYARWIDADVLERERVKTLLLEDKEKLKKKLEKTGKKTP